MALLKATRQAGISAARPSSPSLLAPAWEIGYTRFVDGIDTFGERQQTIKLLALQVKLLLTPEGGCVCVCVYVCVCVCVCVRTFLSNEYQ